MHCASPFPVGEDVRGLNPFIARRFGPSGNAWPRQVPPLRRRVFGLGRRHLFRVRKDVHHDAISHACVSLRDAWPFQRLAPIMERLGLNQSNWVETVCGFGRQFKHAAGRSGSLVDAVAPLGALVPGQGGGSNRLFIGRWLDAEP